jgi:hypothetical protein
MHPIPRQIAWICCGAALRGGEVEYLVICCRQAKARLASSTALMIL